MKKKYQRLAIIISALICGSAAIAYIFYIASENIMYFYTPSDIAGKYDDINKSKKIRVGGLVKDGSTIHDGDRLEFILTDNREAIKVNYSGIIPNLFREGQGIIAEGYLKNKSLFVASLLMAKHDENYMPREVYNSMKEKYTSP